MIDVKSDEFEYDKHMLLDHIGFAAMYEQTAEECAELAQACLKMARLRRGENKPHKPASVIIDNLSEEAADVLICLEELGLTKEQDSTVSAWFEAKRRRMMERLAEEDNNKD